MDSLWGTLWAAGRWLGDIMLAPFAPLPEWLALVGLSAVLGVVLLVTFRWLTPQERLKKLRNDMMAAIYEMRLFIDSPRAIMRCQGRLFWQNIKYIALVMPALLLAAPPVIALFARADLLYGFRPINPGEQVLVRVGLADPPPDRASFTVSASPGLTVREPVVVVPAAHEAWVSVTPHTTGNLSLTISAAGVSETKSIICAPPGSRASGKLSPLRAVGSDPDNLLSDEPFLPSLSPFLSMEMEYPARDTAIPWWLTVLLLSMVVAFALRKPLGVTL